MKIKITIMERLLFVAVLGLLLKFALMQM